MWDFLLSITPQLRNHLQVVISDFERAILTATRRVFPQIRMRGCWFHFARVNIIFNRYYWLRINTYYIYYSYKFQAVFRKWRRLNLRQRRLDCYHNLFQILRMTWSIPLLPPDLIGPAINLIDVESQPLWAEFRGLVSFINYLRRQWLPKAECLSVYGSPIRTNAISEALNGQLGRRLGGKHPNIFLFLGT